jgi:hypothetical protein
MVLHGRFYYGEVYLSNKFGLSKGVDGNVLLLLRKLPRLGMWLGDTLSSCGGWKVTTIQMKRHLQLFYKFIDMVFIFTSS